MELMEEAASRKFYFQLGMFRFFLTSVKGIKFLNGDSGFFTYQWKRKKISDEKNDKKRLW
jgi:hypothetical protein